jgi:ABC-2 type transport system permease protein
MSPGFVEPPVIEPVDILKGGDLDLLDGPPGPARLDQLSLEQADHGLFGVTVSPAALGVALAVIGAAACCCIAYAVSSVAGSADSAGPMVQLTTLPVYFISGIHIPDNVLPRWVLDVGGALTVRPLAVALQAAFVPATDGGSRFAVVPVLIVIAWGVAGLLIAVWRFSWSPRRR